MCVVIDAGGGVLKVYSAILQSHTLVQNVVGEICGDDQVFTKIVLQRTLLRRVSMKPRLHSNPFLPTLTSKEPLKVDLESPF
ncbi:MAG TPA: hypothetical protein DIV46_12745 [Verrucomicrobiales bacterium]|nr:hypothetical protein [Verrucomicrobiales bacterium]